MKKNFFSKAVALAAIMLVGLSLNSCDEKDNAIIDGKVWVKPEVTLTDGGAIVTASSPDDISRMIGRVRQEMAAAAQNGKTFTLDIDAPVLNATSSDNTISIPTINGGDVVVNFKSAISTEAPLVLESKGVADDAVSTTSTNKVEINIPSTSDTDLKINMPFTTVTMNAASGSLTIDELVAKTAVNTLNIGKGVTVNWLKMTGGRALVEEGAKVLGYLRNGDEQEGDVNDAEVNEDGVRPLNTNYADTDGSNWYWGADVYYQDGEEDKPYFVQNLKIVKGKAALVRVDIYNAKAKDALESIIIDDGAAAGITFNSGYWDNEKNVWVNNVAPKGVKLVKGLGNKTAKIYPKNINGWSTLEDGTKEYSSGIDLKPIKELSNVTVDGTIIPDAYDNWNEGKALGKIEAKYGYIDLGPNSTDCDFIAPQNIYGTVNSNVMSKVTNCNLVTTLQEENRSTNIYTINAINSMLTAEYISGISPSSENSTFKGRNISFTNEYVSGNSATVKNCKFETSDKEPYARVEFPYQTKDRSEFNFAFDTCDFAKGFKFSTSYQGWKPWLDKDGKLITKAYFWHELNEDGTIKTDDWGNRIEKRSANESDIPAANKANGKFDDYDHYVDGEGWVLSNGYWIRENSNGFTEDAYFKDFKGYLTLKNSTLDGKAITSKTDMIGSVDYGRNEKGEQATKTYYVIDGVTYEVIYVANESKYRLIEAE